MMEMFQDLMKRYAALMLILLSGVAASAQQPASTLQGRITDELGGIIIGAPVFIADASGAEKTILTNSEGVYQFKDLSPGAYKVRATAEGFVATEEHSVEIAAGRHEQLDITLRVAIAEQKVNVTMDSPLSLDPENNADAIVLRGKDLEGLPDDPDELAAALQALAGPAAGPSGGEIVVDGFKATRPPPKNNIREIRINQNPFSAENDRMGSRSIEIFTKPGTDTLTGQASFSFNNEKLNSRNPFASNRAPFQARLYAINLSGPIKSQKASFFLDLERREINDNAVINATVLDSSLSPKPYSLALLTPLRRTFFSPRIEYQLSQTNTLAARYNYTRSNLQNAGVGELSLLSQSYNSLNSEQSVQLTETAIINKSIVNELRFQYVRGSGAQSGNDSVPTLRVLDAFNDGGAQVGRSSTLENRWELQDYVSWTRGHHALKVGARLRGVKITDISPQNFGGTYIFAGGLAPQLDSNNRVVLDAQQQPSLVFITSLERYRRTLLFKQEGLSPAEIRSLGGGASQFSIATGDARARVGQFDMGAFVQDDWRVRPNFMLSLGLRYETQNNVNSNLNFAPRVRFGWSPSGALGEKSKTVIRGGFGIFYDRLNERLSLQAARFNGINQQQFVASAPEILDQFPQVPPIETLQNLSLNSTTTRLANDLRSPYSYQMALGVDRQLPHHYTLSATFLNFRALHLLRSRNVNAPFTVPASSATAALSARPLGETGDIFQYESSGVFNQHLLVVVLNNRFNRKLTLFSRYILAKASSNTDGAESFPLNSYDLSTEYGRALSDIRHRFLFGGTISLPRHFQLNPLIVASTGRPFNITTGHDSNGDSLFTERPAFATDLSKPGVIVTRLGAFDPNPTAGETIIPRNFGTGPAYLTVNARLSRSFSFGGKANSSTEAQQNADGGERRYGLTFAIQVWNLFNRINAGVPIGNLSSPLFGVSNANASNFNLSDGGSTAAGNRRIEAQIRFNF